MQKMRVVKIPAGKTNINLKMTSGGEDDEEEEGQSEEDGEQELKELGACGNSTTELALDSFKHWLQGIDGGNR